MGVKNFLNDSVSAFRTKGVKAGFKPVVKNAIFGAYHNLPLSYGTPIFERDWDVLIILDACRPDLMEEVSHSYDFLPSTIPTIYSVASRSDTWMQRNFADEYRDEMARTVYVTGNPYSGSNCSEDEFGLLDEVWRYAWNEDVGSVGAEDITDRAIATGRDHDFDRMIIHYMQPHFPSFPQPLAEGIDLDCFGTEWSSVWERIEDGRLSEEEAWVSYRKNLEYALESVSVLLQNLDGTRAILSADHANAFGEWGLYGHPINKPAPVLRRVPWVPVSVMDTHEYVPSVKNRDASVADSVESRLQELGYKT